MIHNASWRAPSNIALVKYWGKYGLQLPRNPSLSFTLSACYTDMQVAVEHMPVTPGVSVLYEGQPRPSFEPKIRLFFNLISDRFPWLKDSMVSINSRNTFPHGAGIASSASAMCALALCLLEIDGQISGHKNLLDDDWLRAASEIARIGSGSASRSVFPIAAIWGETVASDNSSDAYAIPWGPQLAEVYKDYRDTILIVSASEKSVSSTAGHQLMEQLPYADIRYSQARDHLIQLCRIMEKEGDEMGFAAIVEAEALQLHALMMSGPQPFILMEPATLAIIRKVWSYRRDTGIPVCFTLDAGPNVHLLYPSRHQPAVMAWVQDELVGYCSEGRFIEDRVGSGPEKLA